MSEKPAEQPFWWLDANQPELQQLDVQATSDAVIVGAGYTGLTAALVLAQAGMQVQVFDRELPGFGASTRNGGITSGNLRLGARDAIRKLGQQRAQAVYKESVAARQHLRDLINEFDIECDYQMSGRFTGAITTKDLDTMSREAEAFNSLTDVSPVVVDQNSVNDFIGSDAYVGGIVRDDIGHFHPAKFHAGLLRACLKHGVTIHASTAVLSIDENRLAESSATSLAQNTNKTARKQVNTARGSVLSPQVLIATNGYGDGFDPWLRRRIVPIVSRIVVTEKISKNLMTSLAPNLRAMGENRNLYRYYRPSPDGDRMIFGSREPAFNRSQQQGIDHVREGMISIFPELASSSVEFSWAGNVAFSRSELPLLFVRNGVHYAMGYCGSGTVWAPWFGRQVAESMLRLEASGADSNNFPDSSSQTQASAFTNSKAGLIPLYSGKPWFLPVAMLWHGLQDKRHGR